MKCSRTKMFYVYILESINFPDTFYVGYTQDLKKRFHDHNSGYCVHTGKFKPWKIRAYLAVDSQSKAIELEQYLKSHSGRIFQKKYF